MDKFKNSPIKEISVPQRGIIKKLYEKKKSLIIEIICRIK